MEAADDGLALIAELGGGVVGAQEGVAGTASGTEQRGFRRVEQGQVADGPELAGSGVAEALGELAGPEGVVGSQ